MGDDWLALQATYMYRRRPTRRWMHALAKQLIKLAIDEEEEITDY